MESGQHFSPSYLIQFENIFRTKYKKHKRQVIAEYTVKSLKYEKNKFRVITFMDIFVWS